MQVTINLDEEIWQAASAKATQRQITLEQALSELVRLGLKEIKFSQAKTHFTFTLAGGPVTAEDVRQTLEDEDE